ncbi:hypothetical protein [Comamonas thiooxydans]|uniref:hypothetical protein n=1 Tax=Comamonas thiooxydans TaxID=363952 RepID=UPI00050FEF61|nr:hypothetical protein [Comamonas thiooxydans]KGG84868.1 hypothetical protein P609_15120 [Comamonas thiooxydans]
MRPSTLSISISIAISGFVLVSCTNEESHKLEARRAARRLLAFPEHAEFKDVKLGKNGDAVCGFVGFRQGELASYPGKKPFVYEVNTHTASLVEMLQDKDFKNFIEDRLENEDEVAKAKNLIKTCRGQALWETNCSPTLDIKKHALCSYVEPPTLL